MTSEVSAVESVGSQSVRRIGLPLVVASALGSTLGIVIAQLIDDLGDGLLAEVLGGNAVLYNNRVEFTGADDVAWAGGFLLCLIVGFIALFSYPTTREHGVPKLTLLWIILHTLRQAFVQAVLIPFDSNSELARAYATLDAPPGLNVVIAAGGAVGLLLIALSAAAAFLAFTPERRLISTGRRRLILALWLALIPAVVSVFLAIPFFSPDAGSGVVPSLPLTAVILVATLAAAPGTTTVRGPDDLEETGWPWGLAVTLVVLLFFHIAVLGNGVPIDPTLWG